MSSLPASVRTGPRVFATEVGINMGVPRNLGRGKLVTVYSDDITIIIPEEKHLQRVGEAIKMYSAMAGAKIKCVKLVGPKTSMMRWTKYLLKC